MPHGNVVLYCSLHLHPNLLFICQLDSFSVAFQLQLSTRLCFTAALSITMRTCIRVLRLRGELGLLGDEKPCEPHVCVICVRSVHVCVTLAAFECISYAHNSFSTKVLRCIKDSGPSRWHAFSLVPRLKVPLVVLFGASLSGVPCLLFNPLPGVDTLVTIHHSRPDSLSFFRLPILIHNLRWRACCLALFAQCSITCLGYPKCVHNDVLAAIEGEWIAVASIVDWVLTRKKDVVNLSCRAVPRPLMRKAACGSLCEQRGPMFPFCGRACRCALSVWSLITQLGRCTGLHNRRAHLPFCLTRSTFLQHTTCIDTARVRFLPSHTASDRSVVSDVPFALARFYLHAHSLSL